MGKKSQIKYLHFAKITQPAPSVQQRRCFCSHWEATSTLRPEELRQALVKHLKRRKPTSKEWPHTISVPLSLSISTQSARLARSPTGELRPWNIDGPFLGVNGTLCVSFPRVSLCVLDFFFSSGRQLSVWLCELTSCGDAPVVDCTKFNTFLFQLSSTLIFYKHNTRNDYLFSQMNPVFCSFLFSPSDVFLSLYSPHWIIQSINGLFCKLYLI